MKFIHLEYTCKKCGGTWDFLSTCEDYKSPMRECPACKSKKIKYKSRKIDLDVKKPRSANEK